MKKLARLYLGLAFASNLVFLGLLVNNIIERYPDNHVGMDPWRLALEFALIPTFGLVAVPWILPMRSKWRLILGGNWLAVLLFMAALDLFSITVEHGTWCEQGMPEWGTPFWNIETNHERRAREGNPD